MRELITTWTVAALCVSVALFTCGCGDEDDDGAASNGANTSNAATSNNTAATSNSTAATSNSTTSDGDLPPTEEAALLAWLDAESYTSWPAESGIHASTGPHGDVRTFINATLEASLTASNAEHPLDSATVKELYDGDNNLIGRSVMLKVEMGAGGDGWYWFEILNDNVLADGTGAGGCTGCHSAGADFFRTPFPLQ